MKFYLFSSFSDLVSSLSSSSSLPIATHTPTHAIALFVLYLFIRYYRSRSAASAVNVKKFNSHSGESVSLTSSSLSPTRLAGVSVSYRNGSKENLQTKETISIQNQNDDDGGGNYSDTDDDDDETLLLLSLLEKEESLLPGSNSIAERRRYLIANKGNLISTVQKLNSYLEWRTNHIETKSNHQIQIKSTGDKDYDIWVESSLVAMKICNEVENIVLPRIIRTHRHHHSRRIDPHNVEDKKKDDNDNDNMRNNSKNNNKYDHYVDREGYRTFCVKPALMDNNLAKGSTYTQAIAIYLDRSLNRDDREMITILFDCRAGTGWSNNHVLKLIPFLKHFFKVLPPLMPERLQKAIVYPVPYTFMYVWKMISKCLDPMTSKRVSILHGPCKIEAPPPVEQMKLHLYDDHIKELESTRIAGFK